MAARKVELDKLVTQVNESTRRVSVAIDRAVLTLERSEQEADERDADARAAALHEWWSWTPEQRAAVSKLFTPAATATILY